MPRRPDLPCALCGKMMWRGATSAPEGEATCRPCRAARRGCESNYRNGCRCTACLAANAARVRAWTARYKAENGRDYRSNFARTASERKPCGWCGDRHPLNESGTTLNAEGLTHAQWLRYYGRPSPSRELVPVTPARPDRATEPPVTVAQRRGGVFYSGPCEWCGEQFTGWSTDRRARLCSKRCERAESRARRGRFVLRPGRRRSLYERDDWTCQICLEPISREWSAGDPWAPTLDHIEPQSSALIPDHSDANLRTAHAICNSVRSDDRMTDDEVRRLVAERWMTATS